MRGCRGFGWGGGGGGGGGSGYRALEKDWTGTGSSFHPPFHPPAIDR
jgi:hypothetical protein